MQTAVAVGVVAAIVVIAGVYSWGPRNNTGPAAIFEAAQLAARLPPLSPVNLKVDLSQSQTKADGTMLLNMGRRSPP